MEDFKEAKNQVAASFTAEGSIMNDLKQWNQCYGEGGSRKPECNMMLSYHSLPPQSSIISTSSHRIRALKFNPKSAFPHSLSFPRSEAHRRFPTKKWKILCFRHEEFLSGSPNSDSGEKILQEPEKSEISKPIIEKRNWVTTVREAVDAVLKVIGKRWTVPWTVVTILQKGEVKMFIQEMIRRKEQSLSGH